MSGWPPDGWVEPEQVMIDAGAVRLGALFYGPDNPETVVVQHGWADSAWSMDRVAQRLADRYRVISLDLRGHGLSDRGPYNMINLIGDLRGVLESLELDSPILVGHSLGGQVAAQFCGLYPDLAKSLVLAEGTGPPPHRLELTAADQLERQSARRSADRARRPVSQRSVPDLMAAADRLTSAHPLLDPDLARFLAERNTVPVEGGGRRWRHDPASLDWLNGHSTELSSRRWRGITCPVLIVNGSDSYERYWRFIADDPDDYPEPLTGEALNARLANFVDVRFVEIPGGGHMLNYDRPDELTDVIMDFLATVERP